MPVLTGGVQIPEYPGDHFHYVFSKILMAGRANGLQVIDGPFLKIRSPTCSVTTASARRCSATTASGRCIPTRSTSSTSSSRRRRSSSTAVGHPRRLREGDHRGRAQGCRHVRRRDDRRGVAEDGDEVRAARRASRVPPVGELSEQRAQLERHRGRPVRRRRRLRLPDPTVIGPLLAPYGADTSTESLVRADYAAMRSQDIDGQVHDDWHVYDAAYVRACGIPEHERDEAAVILGVTWHCVSVALADRRVRGRVAHVARGWGSDRCRQQRGRSDRVGARPLRRLPDRRGRGCSGGDHRRLDDRRCREARSRVFLVLLEVLDVKPEGRRVRGRLLRERCRRGPCRRHAALPARPLRRPCRVRTTTESRLWPSFSTWSASAPSCSSSRRAITLSAKVSSAPSKIESTRVGRRRSRLTVYSSA